MKRTLNALLATSLVLSGCSVGRAEVRPVEAVVAYDADESGKPIGVFKYADPWIKPEQQGKYGAYSHGEHLLALCQQEGRLLDDPHVPVGAPPVRTTTWIRFEGDPDRWAPSPYFEFVGETILRQCDAVGLAVQSPRAQP